MSRRIEQILEVIEEVREKFQSQSGNKSLTHMRREAVDSVSVRRAIEKQTVLDKFIRQLQPNIKIAAEFDKLLEDWLLNNSDTLKGIILKHRSDSHDMELINNAFYMAPETDILLAQEFGYDPNDKSFKEGKIQFRLHLTKERNRFLVIRVKQKWNREHNGQVHCSVCSFSFLETYGGIGKGVIEAHHTKPIALLTPDTIVTIADLVPACSNCHTMLHRHRPWLTVEELHTIFSEQKKKA